jgi:DNA topoisomerase-6 subunit A
VKPLSGGPPYTVVVRALEGSEDRRFADGEMAAFSHALEQEISLYEPRGELAGPLVVQVGNTRERDLLRVRRPLQVPCWVEEDSLRFTECSAAGIVLIEDSAVFAQLCAVKAWRNLNMIGATGHGLPRAALRRVLHRLSEQFRLPVYLLTDHDTWGYFIFSVLKRGAIGPHHSCPALSLSDVRHIGLHADDRAQYSCEDLETRRWKPHWTLRLKHMRQYRCFRKKVWQNEFDRFEQEGVAITLDNFVERLGLETFVQTYVRRKVLEDECVY